MAGPSNPFRSSLEPRSSLRKPQSWNTQGKQETSWSSKSKETTAPTPSSLQLQQLPPAPFLPVAHAQQHPYPLPFPSSASNLVNMSEAPHLSLNRTDLSDLDPTTTGMHADADVYANRNTQPATAKQNIVNTAQSAMETISNHPATQSIKSTMNDINNGPVAQNVRAEGAKTRNEFADLANARTTPEQPAATGQPLTHYHSMFYRLLSWRNPRATSISFGVIVSLIFAVRYLNLIGYFFKATYITLGITAALELAGQTALGYGLTSQMRPRQYFTIPKASLERLLDDVEQLINFFVIESQRIVFAENVYATVAAFFASLISYFLIKFVPLWGLALIATSVAYLGPLVYIKNKDVIDSHLRQASNVASQQATQIRDLAAQHTSNVTKTVQNYAGEYTHKAQETINQYRGGRSTSPDVKRTDLPSAPKHEPLAKTTAREPVAAPAL
ncbi:hypothetical protein M011DRAFT_465336 [Sporormia fimetaria CBS 119925]|uniref:Reticulon-like protein n=1 Tax=Sporormia fimetaria CBS 119925 TaxID=1340428 RepID=A0A6A6VKD6_9PLEO|nr:hypothetical protein M011DRAFT_465336 [Sporormia fimetaria CBS 119925]